MLLRFVSMTAHHQAIYKVDDLRNMLGHARRDVRRLNTQHCHIFKIGCEVARREYTDLDILGLGRGINLVIDIRDVTYVDQAISPPKNTGKNVEDDGRPSVTDVREAVYGRAADVHCHALWISGFEKLARAAQSIVEIKGHSTARYGTSQSVMESAYDSKYDEASLTSSL